MINFFIIYSIECINSSNNHYQSFGNGQFESTFALEREHTCSKLDSIHVFEIANFDRLMPMVTGNREVDNCITTAFRFTVTQESIFGAIDTSGYSGLSWVTADHGDEKSNEHHVDRFHFCYYIFIINY